MVPGFAWSYRNILPNNSLSDENSLKKDDISNYHQSFFEFSYIILKSSIKL